MVVIDVVLQINVLIFVDVNLSVAPCRVLNVLLICLFVHFSSDKSPPTKLYCITSTSIVLFYQPS